MATRCATYTSAILILRQSEYACSCRFMRKALLDSENGAAAAATPGQLLAEWPDVCLLTSSWLGHVEIAKALLEKGALVSTSDCDGRYM